MQPTRAQPPRGPGSFTPLSTTSSQPSQSSTSSRPALRRVESSGSDDDDTSIAPPSITIPKSRPTQQQQPSSPATPIYAQFTTHTNSSSASLQQHHHYSRPQGTRAVTQGSGTPLLKGHSRKHSATQGLFDSTLPSTNSSSLTSHVGMGHHTGPPSTTSSAAAAAAQAAASASGMSASQIAAQAAVMSHQNSQHSRHRSQTVPFPGDPTEAVRRGSAGKGPLSPPMLSLTEASAPRDSGFGNHNNHPDRYGTSHSSAATAAANVVFPRSGHNSPRGPHSVSPQPYSQPPPPPPASEKPRADKPKVKLFSRPAKIGTKGEPKDKPLPSPGKIGSALSALQRGNFSTSSLVEPSNQSIYNLNNSSSTTIRPIESLQTEDGGRGKEKEKKHHFLSRQKHKLKDEYHLPLSSAASNSRPTDPNAPNPLYNFNVPASPGPNSSGFSKAKKEKKLAERSEARLESEGSFGHQSEWPGPSSLPSLSQQSSMYDPVDPSKLGLHNHMSLDDAWPYLKAKLLVIFEGEDLRLPVEDFNRVVQMHIQWCMHRRSPNAMLDDLRDLLSTGFSSLDRTLRNTPEDRFIPTLVELWMFTFTSILPYMQAVFLPLDLEVSGNGTLMTGDQARDFWGGILQLSSSSDKQARVTPAATVLDVRRLVLIAYRDIVILPRYETLKTIFSRLSLDFLPSVLANSAFSSPPPEAALSTSPSESFTSARPGTAMSLDPSVASYNSTSTTLLGEGSAGGRSRAISNVSFGSHASDGQPLRPFTPSGLPSQSLLGSVREQQNVVDDSKHVTDMVGRMLQCMSVLSSLGGVEAGDPDDGGNDKMIELCKMLKLNWLGRGRTGRNRRGIVGGRVRREDTRDEVRVA